MPDYTQDLDVTLQPQSTLAGKNTLHVLLGGITFGAALIRALAHVLAITLALAPTLLRTLVRSLSGSLAAAVALRRAIARPVSVGLSSLGASLSRHSMQNSAFSPASLQPQSALQRSIGHTVVFVTVLELASGALARLRVPYAFVRGLLRGPQSPERSLVLPTRGGPLRAIATNAADLVLAPEDSNVAFLIDWSDILPEGMGVNSVSALAFQKNANVSDWANATDVTSTFVGLCVQQVGITRIVVGDGAQTLGATYRIKIAAVFGNSPATTLETYFDLVASES